MDSSLARQIGNLKSTHLQAISKRKAPESSSSSYKKVKKSKLSASAKKEEILKCLNSIGPAASLPPANRELLASKKNLASSNGVFFTLIEKIVVHLRTRHQENSNFPLKLEEIAEEVREKHPNFYLNDKQRRWLANEALPNNEKIEVVEGKEGAEYKFKPVYHIRNKKQLLKLLQKTDLNGKGGILMELVEESMPGGASAAKAAIKALGDSVISLKSCEKSQVLFYNDRSYDFTVDEELVKLWNSVQVAAMDENKIDDFLSKHGIQAMQDTGRKVVPQPKKKPVKRRAANFKLNNEHLADVLKDYSSETPGVGGSKHIR